MKASRIGRPVGRPISGTASAIRAEYYQMRGCLERRLREALQAGLVPHVAEVISRAQATIAGFEGLRSAGLLDRRKGRGAHRGLQGRAAAIRQSRPRLADAGVLPWIVEGLAVSYERPFRLSDGKQIVAHRGAFRDWVDSRLPFVAVDHAHGFDSGDPAFAIANAECGTLSLIERADGLYFRCRLAATDLGRRTLNRIRSGDLWGASVAWASAQYGQDAAGRQTLLSARLREISLTAYPCDHTTHVRAYHVPGTGVPAWVVDLARSHSGRSTADCRARLRLFGG